MQVARTHHLRRIRLLLREFPVVALLGARQVGKSTLARQLVASRRAPATWFDLENPADLARLADPGLELRPLRWRITATGIAGLRLEVERGGREVPPGEVASVPVRLDAPE